MNPNFPSLWPPNTRQHNGMYHFLYPLQTTVVSSPSPAYFGPGIQIKQYFIKLPSKPHQEKADKAHQQINVERPPCIW
jgi:hypothetical protein